MPPTIPNSILLTTHNQDYDPPYHTVAPSTGQFIFIIIVFVLCCGMLAWRFADWWKVQPVRPTLSHLRFGPWRLRGRQGPGELQLQPLPPPPGGPTLPPYAPPGNGGNGDGGTGERNGQGPGDGGGGNAGQSDGEVNVEGEGIEIQILNPDRRRSRTPSHNSESSHVMLSSSNDGRREVVATRSETAAERAYHLAIADHVSQLENSFGNGGATNRARCQGPPETVLRVNSSDRSASHGPVINSNTTPNQLRVGTIPLPNPAPIWRTSPAIELAVDTEAAHRKETTRKAYEQIAGRFPSSGSVRAARELDRRAEVFERQAAARDGSTFRDDDFKTIMPVPSTARAETTPPSKIGLAVLSPSALPRPVAKTESNGAKSKFKVEGGDRSGGRSLVPILLDQMSVARGNGTGPLTMGEIEEGLKRALNPKSHGYGA